MSLYPPSPRYSGPALHGGEAFDVLSNRFQRWVSFVDAVRVTGMMRVTASEISAFSHAPRGSINLSLFWKHWCHFVSLRRKNAPIARWLVHQTCVVVAFKAWKQFCTGRPVVHDLNVVTCWKHWKWQWQVNMKGKLAKAAALHETHKKRKWLRTKWEDETSNRAHRKEYELDKRQERLDRFYGLDSSDARFSSSARAARIPEKRVTNNAYDDDDSNHSSAVAEMHRANLNRGVGDITFSRYDNRYNPMSLKLHSRSSRAFSGWRRFTRTEKKERQAQAKRDLLLAESSMDDHINVWDEDAEMLSMFANDEENDQGNCSFDGSVSAAAIAQAAARRGARRDLKRRERKKMEALMEKRSFVDHDLVALREEEERREAELLRLRHSSAVMIQKHWRGFLARSRVLLLKGRKDAYALERVRGLRTLLDRGQETFRKDAVAHENAMTKWAESERRLGALRFANEQAMHRVAVARERLVGDVIPSSQSGRIKVKQNAQIIQKTQTDWNNVWAPLREWNDPARKPFPCFPGELEGDRGKVKKQSRSDRARENKKTIPSPLDDLVFGRHLPYDETAYKSGA